MKYLILIYLLSIKFVYSDYIVNKADSLFKSKKYSETIKFVDSVFSEDIQLNDSALFHLYTNKAESFFYLFKYKEYLNYAIIAYDIADTTYDYYTDEYAEAAYNLGFAYHYMEDFYRAEEYYLKSYEILNEILPDTAYYLAQNINSLAFIYQSSGDFDKALKYFEKSTEIIKNQRGDSSYAYAQNLKGMGVCYIQLNDFVSAWEYLNKSEDILELFIDDHPSYVAEVYYLKGGFYSNLGDTEKAENYIKLAVELMKDVDNLPVRYITQAYNNLAIMYIKNGDLKKAENIIYEIIPLIINAEGKSSRFYINALKILSDLYKLNGDYDKAISIIDSSLFYNKKIKNTRELRKADLLLKKSNVYMMAGEYDKSYENINKAYKKYNNIFSSSNKHLLNIKIQKAKLFTYMKKFDEAYKLFTEVIEKQKDFYLSNATILTENERISYWNKIIRTFNHYNSYLYECNQSNCIDDNKIKLALKNSLFNKKILIKQYDNLKKYYNENPDKNAYSLYRNWVLTKRKISKYENYSKFILENKNINLDDLNQKADSLEKLLNSEKSDFNYSDIYKEIEIKKIIDNLKKDEIAIDIVRYIYTENNLNKLIKYLAFLIHPTGKIDIIFLDEPYKLEYEHYYVYDKSITYNVNDEYSYYNYWSKFEKYTNGYNKIILSKDGVYNQISIESLFNPEQNKYLLDEYDFVFAGNLSDYFNKKDNQNQNEKYVLFGNPDFNYGIEKINNKTKKFSNLKIPELRAIKNYMLNPLPESETEVKSIDSLLKSLDYITEIKTGKDATEENIKMIRNPYVLHIATHGDYFNYKNTDKYEELDLPVSWNKQKNNSFLFFSGANSIFDDEYEISLNSEDGVLTSSEIENMDLSDTELTVLSACKSGLGEVKNGLGVTGLQSAFFKAGTQSMIISLWNVQDNSTKELMIKFYNYWKKDGLNKSDAFRKAKREIARKYKNPFFWGAFELIEK